MKVIYSFRSILVSLVVLVCTFSKSHGQTFHSTLLADIDNPAYTIQDVYQDSAGFVWLATDRGLIRYNGKEFNTIDNGVYRKFSILNNRFAVAIGDNKVLSLINSPQPDSSFFLLLKENKILPEQILDVTLSTNSKIFWILTNHGLFTLFNKKTEAVTLPGFAGDYSACLLNKTRDSFSVIAPGKIYCWNPEQNSFAVTRYKALTHPTKCITLNDSLSFILNGMKVLQLNLTNQKLSEASWMGLPADAPITDISLFRNRILAGTSAHGLWLGKKLSDHYRFAYVNERSEPNRMNDLPFHDVEHIHSSQDGNIWIVHAKGLALLTELAFRRISFNIPMASFDQTAFLKNGKVYFEGDQGIFEGYRTENGDYDGRLFTFLNNSMNVAIASHDNRLWIASLDYSIFYLENNKFSKSINLESRGSSIFLMFPDSNGNVWVMQAPGPKPIIGILKITPNLTTRDYSEADGFQSRMLSAKESPYGQLFCAGIGENSYLYQYDAERDKFVNISAKMNFDYGENFEVHDLAIGRDSAVWLASTAGLLRYKNHSIEKLQFPEFYDSEVVAVAVAPDGSVWFSTQLSGVVRYLNGRYSIFDQRSGFASGAMNYRSIFARDDGTIWVGAREGVYISPEESHVWKKTKTPVILSIRNGKIYESSEKTFPYKAHLKFDFASLTHPVEQVQYSYRFIDRLNDKWTPMQKHDSLVLNNLKDGHYALEIKAKQIGGFEWSKPLQYNFYVDKAWYIQTKAIILYGVIVSLLAIAGFRKYNTRLLNEKSVLELKVAARTKEIVNKNDEILTQLEEMKQMGDEIITQRDNIEHQNTLLAQSKSELEQKVKDRTLELSKANTELAEQNLQLEQFAFMTAHNLRAPVARLLGLTAIFNNEEVSDPTNGEVIRRIQTSASGLDEVIRDIADILQVKKGINRSPEPIEVNPVLQKVIHSFQTEIEEAKLKIVNRLTDSIRILGIPAYLQSVFHNVLSNSIKYADNRKISQLTIESFLQAEGVSIVFSDNGIGFDLDNQREKLFKPFTRLNANGEGKGLGLYLIKIEMESMKGTIDIQSQVDSGTTVTLTFPYLPVID